MFRELWQYIKKRKFIYLMIVISLLVDYGLATVPTRIVQYIIDQIANNVLTQDSLHTQLFYLGGMIIIGYISIYLWIKYLFQESITFQHELRLKLFHKLINMRTTYYDKFRSGDMMTRFTSDTDSISELIGYGSMSILIAIATLLFVIPTMFLINWVITIFSVLPLIVIGVVMTIIGQKQDEVVENSRDAVASLSNEVLEVVEGIRVTRAYAKKELGRQRFQTKTADLRRKANKIIIFQAIYGRIANFGLAVSTTLVIGLGGYFLMYNQITLGQIVALQLYTLLLLEPMWVLSDIMLVYKSAKVSFSKVTELLDTTDDMLQDGTEQITTVDSITFKDYSFTYMGDNQPTLKQISVNLLKGQTLGIVGKTGSGKTTFARQLLMQYPVGSGELLLNGKAIQHYQRASIENLLGYVPQEHVLFSRSVYENLLVGKETADMIEIAAAVEAAAFTEDLERMSDGIETLVGEKGVSISGGQKQRISIARAFLKDPEILILDDSLSAVDAKTERHIIENIQAIRQGKMNIIVTHRLSSVNHADWVIVFDEGRIVEEGTPSDLLAKKGWYFEQYERQQLEEEM